MIAAWMVYAFLVGAFTAVAAWIAEHLLRSHRKPVRWLWLGAMATSTVWPVWTALRPDTQATVGGAPIGPPLVALEPLSLQVGPTSIWMLLDRPLLIFWVLSSAALLLLGFGIIVRTRLLRSGWRGDSAAGRAVLISDNWGPAVVGLLRPQIVLPQWCRGMDEDGLRLILEHESEHLRAGDLPLLALAAAFPVLLPWSLPAWWMLYRIRLAVEGDCDLRVLRRNPQATRAYMELLLEVGRRMPQGRVAAAMLSEPERTLARRIRTMTMPFPKKPVLRGILLAGAGLVLIGVACAVPTPMALEDTPVPAVGEVEVQESGQGLSELARLLMDEPTPTPFTNPPAILNRDEIRAALETEYPPLLKGAGIGGTVHVWFFIDESGSVRKSLINESSGHAALDDAALRVAAAIEFEPARSGDSPVPVWVVLPLVFSAGDGAEARRTPFTEVPPGRVEIRGAPSETETPPDAALSATPGRDISQSPTFTPFTVQPDIKNRTEVARAMEAEYPSLLRDAGIGGTAVVWFFIEDSGTVQRVLLNESSGHEALDQAALRVGREIEFTPALNRDKPVPVWISLPITFTTR